MLNRRLQILNLIFFLSCGSCGHGINILGIDRNGIQSIKVTHKKYSKHVGEALTDLHDAALVPANKYLTSSKKNKWSIKWFNVGLGLSGEISLAGIATLGAHPRIRLFFERENDN